MKLNTKRILAFSVAVLIAGLPLLVGAHYDPVRGRAETNLNNTPVATIILAVLLWLLLILTFVAVIGFVISGLLFITAGGSARSDEAKKWLTYSIIGIIVALSGYIIIGFITFTLGGRVQTGGGGFFFFF